MASKIGLSKRTANTLDTARACAAVYVVVHHVALTHNFQGPLAVFKHFGHQAVIMFFLLSGFVIFANENHRAVVDIVGYGKRRFFRIYPPLIVALGVSAIVALLNGDLLERFSFKDLAGTIVALQDTKNAAPGTVVSPFLGNSPLWSLAYEIWFYVLFPPALWLFQQWGQRATLAIGATAAVCYVAYIFYPNHFLLMTAYFPAWWLGAMTAKAYGDGYRYILSVLPAIAALTASLVTTIIPLVWHEGPTSEFPALQVNHLATALVIAVVFFGPVGKLFSRSAGFVAPILRPVSSISYGLYVLHWPILCQWNVSFYPWGLALAVVVLIITSYIADTWLTTTLKRL